MQLGCAPTLVIGPKGLDFWLEEYSKFETVEFRFINAEHLCRGFELSPDHQYVGTAGWGGLVSGAHFVFFM